ncbi:MAG: hypothetical protein A2Y17_03730 [Clostridiales bacterium GWF2_38_85]|nr:MAG: hypothetical protein A2Y17_03730 [Clostridiales bacterium GWF2_38_85]HBL85319.1 hypothetical protein [Clostridiales bacterium]
MDYTIFAKDLLRRKMLLENAYNAISEEITALENEKTAFSTVSSAVPITGSGTNKYEEKLISLIAKLDDAKFRRMVIVRELKLIRRGFNGLDEYERMILEGFFVHNEKSAADSLMSRFYKERSTIYDDRSKALDKFTRSVYGIVKL